MINMRNRCDVHTILLQRDYSFIFERPGEECFHEYTVIQEIYEKKKAFVLPDFNEKMIDNGQSIVDSFANFFNCLQF